MSLRRNLILFLTVASVFSVSAADLSEQFLSAYQAYQQGERAERDGSTQEALKDYRYAESLLKSITDKDPTWQKAVVEYRLKKTQDGLSRLQAAPPQAEGESLAPAQSSDGSDTISPRSDRAPSITISVPSAQSSALAASGESTGEVKRLKKLIQSLKSDLKSAQSERDAALSAQDRAQDLGNASLVKTNAVLKQQLIKAEDDIANLREKVRQRDSWEKDLKNLQKELDKAVAEKEVAGEDSRNHEGKMANALEDLTKQLAEARAKADAGAESSKKAADLAKQVEQGAESLKQMQAQLDQATQTAKANEAHNAELQAQIKSVTAKLETEQKRAAEVAPLREKIASLQKQSEDSRKSAELSAGKLSELEKLSGKRDADFAVLEEERSGLSKQVQQLAEASKEAAKVPRLQAKEEELRKTSADLQEKLAASAKKAEEQKKLVAAVDEQAKASAKKLQEQSDSMAADRAVLEEEKQRLEARLSEAGAKIAALSAQADSLQPLKDEAAALHAKLDQNAKDLQAAADKETATEKDRALDKDAAERKMAASQSVKEVLQSQNASLQQQLKEALGRLDGFVSGSPDSEALKKQLAEMRQQLDANAKNFEESQRKITELASARPEQEKLIHQKQQELDASRAEASKLKGDLEGANKKISDLQAEATQGQDRLKQLQDQLAKLSTKGSSDEEAAGQLRKELDQLKAEVAASKGKIATLQSSADKTKELEEKLAQKESQLARLKKRKGVQDNEPDAKTADENSLLRGIVLRQVKEEAKRAQAARLLEEEMKKLNVQSQSLHEQVAVLSAPAAVLTPEERHLFKEDQLVVIEEGGGSMQASVAAPLPSSETGAVANQPAAASPAPSAKPEDASSGANQSNFKSCLTKAKEQFDRQDFLQAEGSFKEALNYSPDDYYALSNLGVVEFQLGKFQDAEAVLSKAVQKKSDSSFALTTLGIVNYRQNRLDEAEKSLRKALAINDQDYTAHNYLGIVLAASGKGTAGEAEIMKAIEINKNYADAHFNLAVIYATGKPPSKMMARKHYAKAMELGAPPDPSLERLVQ
jgi:predicted Zn-dependent protease